MLDMSAFRHPCAANTAGAAEVPASLAPIVRRLAQIFGGRSVPIPPGALPTVLMEWSEAMCYTHAGVLIGSTGQRACPFFFDACM